MNGYIVGQFYCDYCKILNYVQLRFYHTHLVIKLPYLASYVAQNAMLTNTHIFFHFSWNSWISFDKGFYHLYLRMYKI